MTIGIYALYWEEQDLVYIGQSQNIEARFKEHLNKMGKGTHTNYKVQNSYNLYGKPELVILEEAIIDKLNDLEILWTKEFDSINNGLNIIEAGQVGWGVNSNASKYTKWQVLKVFSLLTSGKFISAKVIATRIKVKLNLVSSIGSGESHKWLADTYPERYSLLLTRRAESLVCTANKEVMLILDPAGIVHEVTNISQFARQHGLDAINLTRVLRGTRKTHKKWRVPD